MTRFHSVWRRAFALALLLPLLALATAKARDDKAKPLTEADLLRLVELQLSEKAIIERMEKAGLAIPVDEALLDRLKKAGASDELVAAVRRAGRPAEADPDKDSIMLWTEMINSFRGTNFSSRVVVNGEDVGTFDAVGQVAIGKYLKSGWNKIAVTTRPLPGAKDTTYLVFNIGPVRKEGEQGKRAMKPVLWGFINGGGWHLTGNKLTHDLGRDVQEVAVTYDLYYAGCAHEKDAVHDGDYILTGEKPGNYPSAQAITTVAVNGTILNSFYLAQRQVVITPLLKKGANKVVVTTRALKNITNGGGYAFQVIGPMEYHNLNRRFQGPVVRNFEGLVGWERDKKTGQMVRADMSKEETLTREYTFNLEEAPKIKK